jgi:hypothetical protein
MYSAKIVRQGGVTMSETTATAWVMPAVIGLVIGAGGAGTPLFYLKAQATKQLSAVTAELTATSSSVGALTKRVQELEAERSALQSQMTDQQKMAQELAKPDLPIQLSVRKGILDAGYVLTIRNVTAKEIAVNATFGGPSGAEQTRRLVLPPNGVREVGESEGWAFSSRDAVTLKNPNYRDIIYMVPVF